MKILRSRMYEATKEHLRGQREKHIANAEVMLSNPVGIGEHSDVIESIVKELEQVAHYDDMLNALRNHFQ
jgi:hypothetical protein|tara:strand:- start:663 stop:872 length:210 start_codon:yes stop_codon:yes gene_type:complete